MKFTETYIEGLIVIEPTLHRDNRGWFKEAYSISEFQKNNIHVNFIQDNHSYSAQKGILRGLHYQIYPFAQTKLVRCTRGRVWDVAVDLRKSSPTYLKWFGLELSENNHHMLLIPKGFAHGFITLEDNCEVEYKVDEKYSKDHDRSLYYNDETINILWPLSNVILSTKDSTAPRLNVKDVIFL